VLLGVLLLLLGFEVEVGGGNEDFLGFQDGVVAAVLVGTQSRQLLIHNIYNLWS
jgi:hypothetical protein